MTEVVPDWLVALFFAQAIGAVAYLIQAARLRGLLQQRHPQVWKSLGSPTLFLSSSPGNGMSVSTPAGNCSFVAPENCTLLVR